METYNPTTNTFSSSEALLAFCCSTFRHECKDRQDFEKRCEIVASCLEEGKPEGFRALALSRAASGGPSGLLYPRQKCRAVESALVLSGSMPELAGSNVWFVMTFNEETLEAEVHVKHNVNGKSSVKVVSLTSLGIMVK